MVGLAQHPTSTTEHPVLLAVDQQLGECAALWVAPELADPLGALEVGEHQDVEQFGSEAGPRASSRPCSSRSSSSGPPNVTISSLTSEA